MQPIHERMPVIIPASDYQPWLDKSADEQAVFDLLDNSAYSNMVATPISDWVNNPSHNDESCLH
jgi:putative SOS response-associated peptidase YedK